MSDAAFPVSQWHQGASDSPLTVAGAATAWEIFLTVFPFHPLERGTINDDKILKKDSFFVNEALRPLSHWPSAKGPTVLVMNPRFAQWGTPVIK